VARAGAPSAPAATAVPVAALAAAGEQAVHAR
jgi:hypothetical protein